MPNLRLRVAQRRISSWLSFLYQRLRLWMVEMMSRYAGRHLMQRVMWWTQAKFVMAIVAVVFWNDRVLLLEHSYRPRYPWGLPTGWMRYGESLEEAVRRELMEECGLDVGVLQWIDARFPTRRHFECVFWTEVLESSQTEESEPSEDGEITSWGWFDSQHGLPEKLLPTQRPLIERAIIERHRFYQMLGNAQRDGVAIEEG